MTVPPSQLYKRIASSVDARKRCMESYRQALKNPNSDQMEHWSDMVTMHYDHLMKMQALLPSGAGIDSGTAIDLDASTSEKIVLNTSYHHMNESGMYDGWTEHRITITPSLIHTIDIKIGGRNRNDIKEYLHEVYYFALITLVDQEFKPVKTEAA